MICQCSYLNHVLVAPGIYSRIQYAVSQFFQLVVSLFSSAATAVFEFSMFSHLLAWLIIFPSKMKSQSLKRLKNLFLIIQLFWYNMKAIIQSVDFQIKTFGLLLGGRCSIGGNNLIGIIFVAFCVSSYLFWAARNKIHLGSLPGNHLGTTGMRDHSDINVQKSMIVLP